jgi:hypothetical protein
MKMDHIISNKLYESGRDETVKTYASEKHKKSEKNNGSKPAEERHKGEKKTPARYENFNGKPVE